MAAPLILNRYRPLETKGKGGFGTVDVAWDNRLQRRVALKRIPLSVDETALPGIQEARTAALLNDPHIASVLDFEVTGTEAIIIMEYVDGPTLGALLKESVELLDLDTITTIIGDVGAALSHAHENQVLHLDIKPDNILFDHNGQTKVTDFGLSELSGTAGFAEPQGGTIGYMPPEQLTQGEVDERTDLWALAILLYQLLTGKNPFLAQSTEESLERIHSVGLPLPSALRADLDPVLDDLLVTALFADKDQRFDSVAEFLHEVKPFLGKTQSGRRKLKYRVNALDLDEVEFTDEWHQEQEIAEEDEEDWEQDELTLETTPPWDRFHSRLRGLFSRLVAALACGSFAFVGLTGFDLLAQTNLQFFILAGVVALVAFASFIAPQLGSALAAIALVAGVIARGSLVVGIVLAVLLVVWWLLLGRKGPAESNLVMLTPLLGALGIPFALPLLTGYFLSWKRAVPTALLQGLTLIALVPLTGSSDFVHTGYVLTLQTGVLSEEVLAYITAPMPWVMLLAFVFAALVMALVAGRQKRWSGLFGGVDALIVLIFGCIVAPLLIDQASNYVSIANNAIGLTLSFILVLILVILGVPTGSEPAEEELDLD
jgi:serine/threonine protein kinase